MPSSNPSRPVTPTQTLTPDIALSVSTSPSQLVKAARQFQLEKTTAQSRARALQRKLADLTNGDPTSDNEASPPKRQRVNTADTVPDDGTSEETQVTNAGRHFVILYGLWLRGGEGTFHAEYNIDVNEQERFENRENKIRAQRKEIERLLSPQLCQFISTEKWVAKLFINGMKQQRANTATRIRSYCAAILNVSDSDMLLPETRAEKFRERIGWVVNNQGVGSYSTYDVPILHTNESATFDIQTAFLNPVLMQVFVAVIRGPKAAKQLSRGTTLYPTTDTMARKYNIRNTTPGAIASSAVLTHWALSADEHLQNSGTTTGIDWLHDFERYLEILLTGLRKKKKSIFNIFREWDKKIFPHSEPAFGAGGDKSTGNSDGLKNILTMLDADSEAEEAS